MREIYPKVSQRNPVFYNCTLRNYLIEIALDIFNLLHNKSATNGTRNKGGNRRGTKGASRFRFITLPPTLVERDFHIATSGKAERARAGKRYMTHTTQHDDNTPRRSSHVTQRLAKDVYQIFWPRDARHGTFAIWREIYIYLARVCPIIEECDDVYRCGKVHSGPAIAKSGSVRASQHLGMSDERSHVSRNGREI